MIPMEQYERSAAYLRQTLPFIPDTAVVLGSGLGGLAKEVEQAVSIAYADIPGFPRSTVASHAGVLMCGLLQGKRVLLLCGRFHYYEGYSPETVTFYVRVLKLLGIKTLVLTNAAGGVNETFHVGDLMLITDHIKLFSVSPVRGEEQPAFGQRFFDLTKAYSPRLRKQALEVAKQLGMGLKQGVYFFMPGPEFETPAEIRAIRLLGGDAVGMSTVMEAVSAAQCGIEVLGLSCITNMAAGVLPDRAISDDEVTANASLVSGQFSTLMKAILAKL